MELGSGVGFRSLLQLFFVISTVDLDHDPGVVTQHTSPQSWTMRLCPDSCETHVSALQST